jgi:hypothetical protein
LLETFYHAARTVSPSPRSARISEEGDKWVRKAQKGPSDPQAARGPTTRKKSTHEPRAPTPGGKVAETEKEAGAKAKEARKENAKSRREKGTSKR